MTIGQQILTAPAKYQTPYIVADAYKNSHPRFMPKGINRVVSNFTPRKSRFDGVDHAVVFGVQYVIKKVHDLFATKFFNFTQELAVQQFQTFYKDYFGVEANEEDVERCKKLHTLGYLPVVIWAMPEGELCNIGMPFWLIYNNLGEDYSWVTNFLETMISNMLWSPITVATISREYRKVFKKFAEETSDIEFLAAFQGHDFSMRGLRGLEDAEISGMSWVLFSKGSDTCPCLNSVAKYYGSLPGTLIATSVPATEHSLECSFLAFTKDTKESDKLYVLNSLTAYPTGVTSVVSDGFDFWRLVTEILPDPEVKAAILAREGTLVIRPDSSPKTPVEILIGDSEAETEWERKGLVEVLWDIFGGVVNSKGYKQLDSHIGCIYGDSITLEFQHAILEGLKRKGFASTNVVLGIGSYSIVYNTRDSLGMAIKATAIEFNHQLVPIWKDPKTDNGEKKSAKGLIFVEKTLNGLVMHQDLAWDDWQEKLASPTSAFRKVYEEGKLLINESWETVTERALASL